MFLYKSNDFVGSNAGFRFGKGHQISVKPWAEGMHPFAFLVRLKLADLTAAFIVQHLVRTVQRLDYTDHICVPYGSRAGP